MTVPTYLKNMDDAHLKALSLGERLDLTGEWKIRQFIIPTEGPAFEFQSMVYPNRDQAASVQRLMQIDIGSQVQLGLIAGGTPATVPVGFVFGDEFEMPDPQRTLLMKFDAKYGQRFPTALEVAEEMGNRGFGPREGAETPPENTP